MDKPNHLVGPICGGSRELDTIFVEARGGLFAMETRGYRSMAEAIGGVEIEPGVRYLTGELERNDDRS